MLCAGHLQIEFKPFREKSLQELFAAMRMAAGSIAAENAGQCVGFSTVTLLIKDDHNPWSFRLNWAKLAQRMEGN
jgi:hypothetical protein